MGIFSRFRDIVGSNINSILDKAEDPEKMVRMMILEMEDTLAEIRGACAAVMADQRNAERSLAEAKRAAGEWEDKAALALRKGREELAREALLEKRRFDSRAGSLQGEAERLRETVSHFQADIAQLEQKLTDAREKQRSIIARRSAAQARHQAQTSIRRAETSEAFAKFEAYERGIDRLEADAELINGLRPKETTVRDKFAELEREDQIEGELERLRRKIATPPELPKS